MRAPILLLLLGCHGGDDLVETDSGTDDSAADTDTDTEPGLPDEDRDAIEARARTDLLDSNASGAQIAVWKDGRLLYHSELGSSHPTGSTPVTPEMLFQVGSDTKKMTAITVLQQEAAGTLHRDDTVADAIPDLTLAHDPDWSSAATLHHLLSHQGGLYDYTPWNPDPDDAALSDTATGVFATNAWQMATPGATWNYSNPNFSIAGLAAERAAATPWADLVEDGLFAPLGMSRSFARKTEVEQAGPWATGRGYSGWNDDPFDPFFTGGSWAFGVVALEDVTDNAFTRPAGLVWSTASDMARFGGFLIDGDPAVLPDALRTELAGRHVRVYPSYDRQFYGYGLFVLDGIGLGDGWHDGEVWAHGGNTLSFTSATWLVPSSRLSISILSNGYGDDFEATAVEILGRLADLPLGTAPTPPTEETSHDRLVGTYRDPYVGDLVVTEVDGKLRIAAPDLEARGISASGTLTMAITDVYTFPVEGQAYDVTFVADGDGTYRWLRNRLFVGTRVEASATRPVLRDRTAADWAVALAEQRRLQRLAPWR